MPGPPGARPVCGRHQGRAHGQLRLDSRSYQACAAARAGLQTPSRPGASARWRRSTTAACWRRSGGRWPAARVWPPPCSPRWPRPTSTSGARAHPPRSPLAAAVRWVRKNRSRGMRSGLGGACSACVCKEGSIMGQVDGGKHRARAAAPLTRRAQPRAGSLRSAAATPVGAGRALPRCLTRRCGRAQVNRAGLQRVQHHGAD